VSVIHFKAFRVTPVCSVALYAPQNTDFSYAEQVMLVSTFPTFWHLN
jgi:hypothetical protein